MSAECNKCGRVMWEHGDKEHCSCCYTEILEKKLKEAINALERISNCKIHDRDLDYIRYQGCMLSVLQYARVKIIEIKEGE